MNDFMKAMEFYFKWEGGYVDHPSDPGGETNMGITWPTLRKAIEAGLVPKETTIKSLTKAQVVIIIKYFYWDFYNCGQYKLPLNVAVFDSYVQHNPKVVKEQMIGPANGDWRVFLTCRKDFYVRLVIKNPKLKVFAKGWTNRMNDLSKFCQILEQDKAP